MPLTQVPSPMLAPGTAGNGPAFSASKSDSQTVSTDTYTKVNLNTESFDTANCFDTTNARFTPNVAGYYLITAQAQCSGSTSTSRTIVYIAKNGTSVASGMTSGQSNSQGSWPTVSQIIYMNGSTDYLEMAVAIQGSGTLTVTGSGCFFTGCLVRSA